MYGLLSTFHYQTDIFIKNIATQIVFKQRILPILKLLQSSFNSSIVICNSKYQNIWSENLLEMPKSKEYLSSDELSSNSSEDEKPKKKVKRDKDSKNLKSEKSEDVSSSKKATSSNKADESEPTWELGNMKEVKVREWKGKFYVDIREMYVDKSGDIKPGRKGISLNPPQFRKLLECIGEVEQVVKAKS